MLYQLSYQRMVAGGAGFEPAVSGIKTRCLTRLGEPPKIGGRGQIRTDIVYPEGTGLQPVARPPP